MCSMLYDGGQHKLHAHATMVARLCNLHGACTGAAPAGYAEEEYDTSFQPYIDTERVR